MPPGMSAVLEPRRVEALAESAPANTPSTANSPSTDGELTSPIDWRRCVRLGALGAVITLALVLVSVFTTPIPTADDPGGYTTTYNPPHGRFEGLLDHVDGQAYATLAQDPTWSRPEAFLPGPGGIATFSGRPVLPYVLWAASLGQPGAIPVAYVVIEGLAGGLLVLAAAALLHARGRAGSDRLSLVLLALPGALFAITWLGQDVLALGLGLLGLVLWSKPRPQRVAAIALLTLSVLTRETMLILVATMFLERAVQHGLPPRLRLRPGDLWLALPGVTYVAWGVFISAKLDAPTTTAVDRHLGLPLMGLFNSVSGWSLMGGLIVASQMALVVFSLVRSDSRVLRWQVAAFALTTTLAAEPVWREWDGGLRVILPLVALAILNLNLTNQRAASVAEA